ncbi:MAG: S8 family serine peptidase [Rhodothermales bacterium]|nr:S8 family serine peptidase [Rhodothermales bacterium]
MQGCDALSSDGLGEAQSGDPLSTESMPAGAASKLRHAALLEVSRTGAGKVGDDAVNLVVGFDAYEADGVTRRVMDKYAVTKRMLTRYGDSIHPKVETDDALSAITVQLDADSLDSFIGFVENDPDLAWVEPDIVLDGPDVASRDAVSNTQYVSWGVQRVGAREATSDAGNAMVHVYVFDSGITHDDVNVVESIDFSKLYRGNIDANWADVISTYWLEYEDYWSTYWDAEWTAVASGQSVKSATGAEDRTGHGTHVAGIIGAIDDRDGIAGVAPNVALHNIKVLGNDGRTDITTVLAAIEYVTEVKHAHPAMPIVVNMSLGADIGTTGYNALDEAIERSIRDGVVYVVAAGNNAKDASTYSPAHVRDAITVGAFNEASTFSSFSNYGPAVDLLAPGEFIVSLSITNKKFLAIQAGTSQAAPFVAGAAALYLTRFPNASPYQVQQAIIEVSRPGIQGAPASTTDRSVYVGDILKWPSALAASAPAPDLVTTEDANAKSGPDKGDGTSRRGMSGK